MKPSSMITITLNLNTNSGVEVDSYLISHYEITIMAYILQGTTSCGYSCEIRSMIMVEETFLSTGRFSFFFPTIPCDMHVFIFRFFQWAKLISAFLYIFLLACEGCKSEPRMVVWHYIGLFSKFSIFLFSRLAVGGSE